MQWFICSLPFSPGKVFGCPSRFGCQFSSHRGLPLAVQQRIPMSYPFRMGNPGQGYFITLRLSNGGQSEKKKKKEYICLRFLQFEKIRYRHSYLATNLVTHHTRSRVQEGPVVTESSRNVFVRPSLFSTFKFRLRQRQLEALRVQSDIKSQNPIVAEVEHGEFSFSFFNFLSAFRRWCLYQGWALMLRRTRTGPKPYTIIHVDFSLRHVYHSTSCQFTKLLTKYSRRPTLFFWIIYTSGPSRIAYWWLKLGKLA